ncbi:MAG TPA: HEAT repeat domain-containing protein [Methanocorpusculum sp.]|nr:HEAT repeat domain-containing protein [Candidatus Methanocorpusculum equi]MCQ2357982.1 HEAT repeat domain-containing protein [Methanocorpusculum sp.]HJJ32960.1 HEAT repeat domain-containing protein [Methanocorpusculum sp.]
MKTNTFCNTMAPEHASQEHIYLNLFSPDKNIRAEAAAGLAAAGEEGAKLVLPLLSDTRWVLRYRAAEVLGRSGCRTYAKELLPLLSDEKDHVRYMAVKSLGFLCGNEAAPVVRPLLSDENPFVVRKVREVLNGAENYADAEENSGTEKNSDAERYFSEGVVLYGKQEFAAAESAFLHAAGENGDNPNYLCYLALCRKALGRDEDARSCFADALRTLPESVFVRYEYADLLLRMGEHNAAAAEFSRILSGTDPENLCWRALSHLGCGILHLEADNLESAIQAFSSAEALASEIGDAALCARIGSEIEKYGL